MFGNSAKFKSTQALQQRNTLLANARGWDVLGREFLTMWQQAHGAPQGAASVIGVQCGLIVLIENAFSQAELALAQQSTDNLLQQYIEGLTRQILPMLTSQVEQAVGQQVESTNITSDIEQNWMMVFLKFDRAT